MLSNLCADCFPIHGVVRSGDANWRCDGERRRRRQQRRPTINPFVQCMQFHFQAVIRALHVSCVRPVNPKRLDCCAAPVAIDVAAVAVAAVDPVCAIVPVSIVPNVHPFGCGDAPEIREKNFVGNAKVVDSNAECLSALFCGWLEWQRKFSTFFFTW